MTVADEVVHPEEVEHPPPPLIDRVISRGADLCATWQFLLANPLFWLIWIPTKGFGLDNSGLTIFTLIISQEAIVLSVAILINQRLAATMRERESEADLKNDAIAAEEGQRTSRQLDRIEERLKERDGHGG